MGCDVPFNYSKLAEESLESSMSVVDENGDGNLTWVEYLHGQFGYTEEELEKEREKNEKNSDNHDSDYEASIPPSQLMAHRAGAQGGRTGRAHRAAHRAGAQASMATVIGRRLLVVEIWALTKWRTVETDYTIQTLFPATRSRKRFVIF